MIALWMMYSTIVAAVLGVAAALVEKTASPIMRNRRWIWVAAVVLSAGLPIAVAGLELGRPAASSARLVRPQQPAANALVTETGPLASRLAELLAAADSRGLARLDRPFAIGWGIAALLAFAAYGTATWSLARRRRTWRAALVDGQRVLLAPAVGPAVVGVARPAIVVPEWSLELSPEQRTLMIEHERQHVRARDPLLVHAAAMIAMMTPWNVALWWLHRRLRLAVELDCDARVLAGGRDVRVYGELLLDVCSRRRGPSAVLAPALLERTSSLTRRILAMHPAPVRHATARAALGIAAALSIVVVACEMPTPDMLAPDGTSTPTRRVFGNAPAGTALDGIDDIRNVVAQYFPSIARGEGEPSVLFVVRSPSGEILLTEAQPASRLSRTREEPAGSAPGEAGESGRSPVAALPAAVRSINPTDIAGIEVSKHAAGAVAPKAVSVIVITLKPGVALSAEPAGQ